jgi:dynein regulatory complex protein 1
MKLSGDGEEFNTNVPDKDERKRLRKKRIDKRHSTETKNNDEVAETNGDSHKTGGQQVGDSLFHLDRRKHTGLQDVTEIRIISDDNELKRRGKDEDLRRERLSKLQKEAIHSAKANAAIEMRWAELLERDIPQELHKEIQIQMVTCRSSIKSKDDIIKEFQRQLRGKDEEYVRTLRKQSEDVGELLARIRKEFVEMQGEYGRETEAIEDAYTEERQSIIGEYGSEIDSMFDHRRGKEVFYKEAKQKREDQYQREIEDLITKGADQYNKLKIDLEKNIQTLKEQLEEIRATYQLNTEKLDYNYRVLTELDVEKNAELARYKRRLAKLKDQMNQLVTRYSDMEGADTKTNNDLTDDYRSLTQKYKELQAKFRHFEVADSNKYDDVWAMHEEEVKSLVDQLLKADKIIAEQQLGWQWKGPDMNALQMVLGRHGSNIQAAPAVNTTNTQGDESSQSGGGGQQESPSATGTYRYAYIRTYV